MKTEIPANFCKNCAHPIRGRSDKQFCNDSCRNVYNNARNQQDNNFTRNITAIIKRNRSKLKDSLTRQLTIITKADLVACGFNWDYHTHCKPNKKGSAVTFCFDYGFQILSNNKVKIIYQPQS